MPSPAGYPERELADGSRICGEGGTIRFFADGQVMVEMSWTLLEAQSRKLHSRFKADQWTQVVLEHLTHHEPSLANFLASSSLRELIEICDQTQFERSLDAYVSAIKAARELWINQDQMTPNSRRFLAAVGELARKHQRPPTKLELKDYFWDKEDYRHAQPSRISELCRSHGFGWLLNGHPGRPRKSLH